MTSPHHSASADARGWGFLQLRSSGKYASLFAAVAALGLSGCGAKRMKVDFVGFEKAYAETSNREMLLNLARLENRDPTYFFKLGQISTSYRMQASLTGAANYVTQGTVPGGGNATGGGTPLVGFENDPAFTFIPVNDETNAQLLLRPVPAETLYILYQQGWRADQLFRLMVDRIELTRYTPKGCTVETIRNVPPPVYSRPGAPPDADYTRDAEALSTYVTFLRVSAVVYALQKYGNLLLRGSDVFVPYDSNAAVTNAPSATEIVNASAKNAVWENVNGKWLLGEKVFSPVFFLNPQRAENGKFLPDEAVIKRDILASGDLEELRKGPALDEVLTIMGNGFSVSGAPNPQHPEEGPCPAASAGLNGVTSHLVLRSLLGMMTAAAQEQAAFDVLAGRNPIVPANRHLPSDQQDTELRKFADSVPRIERLPLLRLIWKPENQATSPLVQVNYRSNTYLVSDSAYPEAPENRYWNRDLFRLLNQLTSQVTVDISKFPLPEILQLRTE